MYDPKSLKAEEFICHEEIEDTLKYADENKDNMPLIREILDKAVCVRDFHTAKHRSARLRRPGDSGRNL